MRPEQILKTVVSLKRAVNYLDQSIKKDLIRVNLTLNEFGVLEILLHKGPQTVQQIVDKILVANSSTTYVVDRLCSKGFVARKVSEVDRRVTYIHLTSEGEQLICSYFQEHQQLLDQLFHALDDQQLGQLHDLLKTMMKYNQKNKLEKEV